MNRPEYRAQRHTHNRCPACKGVRVVDALPITRTARNGQKIIVAKRLRCEGCDYTDRTTAFRGALSLNWDEHQRDIAGKRIQYGEEVED